jgi:hypothetical protein
MDLATRTGDGLALRTAPALEGAGAVPQCIQERGIQERA